VPLPKVEPTSRRRTNVSVWRSLLDDRAAVVALVLLFLLVLAAAVPNVFATAPPNQINVAGRLAPPSPQHWLGTDDFGRDVWSRVVFGAQVAMLVACSSMLLAGVIGVPLGLLSGWYGGPLDSILMRLQDAILAFPSILFAILLVALLGPSAFTVAATMCVIYVPRFARLVRANVLLLKRAEFIIAGRALGATDVRMMAHHLLPNVLPTILVQTSLGMAFAILVEASLSYLGLGVQPPQATWGSMLGVAQRFATQAPWYVLAPGSAIFITVLLLNFIGDRLRDHLDPRLRRIES
jgi:ABC-type dipeptide/oligopeptide/nickel transport system permease subunit